MKDAFGNITHRRVSVPVPESTDAKKYRDIAELMRTLATLHEQREQWLPSRGPIGVTLGSSGPTFQVNAATVRDMLTAEIARVSASLSMLGVDVSLKASAKLQIEDDL
jgi:hypothetical protein